MTTIDFCIPFISGGLHYLEFLVANIRATAAAPERISIIVSTHGENELAALKASPVWKHIDDVVDAPPIAASNPYYPSANHARAINALAAGSSADIVIFSDHDMAFVRPQWDLFLERILAENDLCGVPYPRRWLYTPGGAMPATVPLGKYQGNPTLKFLSITRTSLDGAFARKPTDFDAFLLGGGLPYQIVHTREQSEALGLPLGCVQWLDTGHEIPLVIRDKKLRAYTFVLAVIDNQPVFPDRTDFAGVNELYLPEVFVDLRDRAPVIAHFNKGFLKTQSAANNPFGFDKFRRDIESWLAKAAGRVPVSG